MKDSKRQKPVSMNPDHFNNTYASHIRTMLADGVDKPAVVGRSVRDSLRVSYNDTISSLPIAIETLRRADPICSHAEFMQWLTYDAINLIDRQSEVQQCIEAYDAAADRAAIDKPFRDMRERGVAFRITDKASKGMTIWAYSDKIANGLENRASSIGMPLKICTQLFICGVILQYRDQLPDSLAIEVETVWKIGICEIAKFRANLEFDEMSLDYSVM